MNWPNHIRLLSLPALVCAALFLWNAVVYGLFSRVLPIPEQERKKFLYFGLTSLFLGLYSIGSVFLYSSPDFASAYFWNRWQGANLIPIFVLFVLFATAQLGIQSRYWTRVLPIVTLLLMPFMIWGTGFVRPQPAPKFIQIGSYNTTIFEAEMGPLALPLFVWILANLFVLGTMWARSPSHRGRLHLIAFVLFLLAAINDILVTLHVYHFFYLLELGFVIFILTMSVQLFRDYIHKSREIESLNEEMRFLMSTISHDFYSPLISIEGFSERLCDNLAKDSSSTHYLQRIQANSQFLRDLIRNLSEYLRIGRVEEPSEWVNAGQIVQQALAILDVPHHRASHDILLPKDWPELCASPTRLKQIFLNILQNAMKHGDQEHFWLRIQWEPQRGGILFKIEDRGPGIPAHLKDKIFSSFFRELRGQPGVGMGLAIVKKSVEALNGRIWVDTEYRDGARFCFWLPESQNRVSRL